MHNILVLFKEGRRNVHCKCTTGYSALDFCELTVASPTSLVNFDVRRDTGEENMCQVCRTHYYYFLTAGRVNEKIKEAKKKGWIR